MSDLRVSFPKPCTERWDKMRPEGCNRHCASCDKTIHDLSEMTIEEVEKLIALDPEPCVRAQINRDGDVHLKRSGFATKRALTAVGASAVLATAACQSLPSRYPSYGSISGKVDNGCWDGVVTAVASDGRRYQGIVDQSSRKFVVRYVPLGKYELLYSDRRDLQNSEQIGRVIVSSESVSVGPVETENGCVVTGLMIVAPDYRG